MSLKDLFITQTDESFRSGKMQNLPAGQPVTGSSEYLCDECPACFKEKKFYFNLEKGMGECKSCHIAVHNWGQFRKLFDGKLDISAAWRSGCKSIQTKVVSKTDIQLRDYKPFEAQRFLNQKGVTSDKDLFKWDPDKKLLLTEIQPWSPEYPVEYLRRHITYKNSKWIHFTGTHTSRYGYGLSQHCGSTVIWVEGVFDVVVPGLLGCAVALLGTVFREDCAAWAKKKGIKRHVVWLDPDDAGVNGAKKAAKLLTYYGHRPIIIGPKKEFDEEIVLDCDKEPGDFSPEELASQLMRWT